MLVEHSEEADITTIEHPDTKIMAHIYHFNNSVKIESHDSGDTIYFKSVQEIKTLRDMLNKLLELKPTIK
jgi:hypothetical protein